jgi:hypothetical protein
MPIQASVLPLGVDTSSTAYEVGEVTGMVIVAVVAFAVIRRYRASVTSAAVVLVAAAIVIFGLKHLLGASNQAWATSEGVNLRAGFIVGCSNGVSSRVTRCECVFKRVSRVPPYDTPTGFMEMVISVRRFEQTRDLSALPPALVEAGRSCAH